METKKCFKCGQEKQLFEFYKHPKMLDGHLGKCKECTKKDVHENYHKNREHYAKYEKGRFKRPERKKQAIEYQKKRRRKYPARYHANNLTNSAIRDKRLIKGKCEICGATRVEAHHDDYYKPLEVRWLCRKHHLGLHGRKAYFNRLSL